MAKTLSFTDTSPQTVKIGDTTTSFTLICGNDNVATDLTSATSITIKLGNASGYLKSAIIDPTSLTDPTTGQIVLALTADLMVSLTAGDYQLEVWGLIVPGRQFTRVSQRYSSKLIVVLNRR